MNKSDSLRFARDYRAAGLSVIPVGPDKKPLCPWKAFQETPAGEAQLQEWFGRRRPTNLGIVCGRVSGGLLVLDFDHDARQTYRRWRVLVGRLAERLPVVRTGQGLHVYLRAAEPGGNRQLALNAAGQVLIETRGEGGYVIAPPSRHASGRQYRWVQGRHLVPYLASCGLERVLKAAMALNEKPADQVQACQTGNGTGPRPALNGPMTADSQRLRRYAHAVLAREAARLAVTPVGGRNQRLNQAAFRIGRYVGAELLSPQLVEDMLVAACAAGGNQLIPDDGLPAFQATLRSGLQAGMARAVQPAALLQRLNEHEDPH